MRLSQLHKLYLANFLTGLVFWYGIEKLFMSSIGLDAVAVGIVAMVGISLNLLLDIPSGIIADKWSRKGMLIISSVALGLSSLILGLSTNFWTYLAGYAMYSLYIVATSGTYQAILYDSLHEGGRTKHYSKFAGRAYSLFLVGAGMGNIVGGFIAAHSDYRMTFFVSVVSCVLNIVVMLSLHEPTFHKKERKERVLTQISASVRAIARVPLLRTLTVVLTLFWIVEVFKLELSQLYIFRYVSSPETVGTLWALYAFLWALGGFVAHRFRERLTLVILFATMPYVGMAFNDSWTSIVLFMLQIFAMGVLQNLIETRVQENTPSAVRSSIMSVLSSLGRLVGIPSALFLGWLIQTQNAFVTVQFLAVVCSLILCYWLVFRAGKSATLLT